MSQEMATGKQLHSLVTTYPFRNLYLDLGIHLRKMTKGMLHFEKTGHLVTTIYWETIMYQEG